MYEDIYEERYMTVGSILSVYADIERIFKEHETNKLPMTKEHFDQIVSNIKVLSTALDSYIKGAEDLKNTDNITKRIEERKIRAENLRKIIKLLKLVSNLLSTSSY